MDTGPTLSKSVPLTTWMRSPDMKFQTLLEGLLCSVLSTPLAAWVSSRPSPDLPFVPMTYQESWSRIRSLAHTINPMGLFNPIILMPNCPDNLIVMYALYSLSLPTIPLYTSMGPEALSFIFNETRSNVLFIDHRMVNGIIRGVLNNASSSLTIILCNGMLPACELRDLKHHPNVVDVFGLEDLVLAGDSARRKLYLGGVAPPDTVNSLNNVLNDLDDTYLVPPSSSTLASITYTSGTTSTPKGVMLTHSNFTSLINSFIPGLVNLKTSDVHFSYLPLAHIFERVVTAGISSVSGQICFMRYHGDPKIQATYLLPDMQAASPTIFCAAPRVTEKLRKGVWEKVNGMKSGLLRELMTTALKSQARYVQRWNRVRSHPIFSPLLKKVAKGLGLSEVRYVVVGSAPSSVDTLLFLQALLPNCVVVEGYGLTETTGGVSITSPHTIDVRDYGTVGGPVGDCEIRLGDQNEICVRGPNVAKGYYAGPNVPPIGILDEDGWFRTGDVGTIVRGRLKIVDRLKNIFKLQQGEFVSVEKIEGVIVSGVQGVEQCWVYGDPTRRYVIAFVVLGGGMSDGEIGEACRKASLRGFETPRRVKVVEEPFSTANDLATPTFKLKRKRLKEVFKDDIDRMYAEIDKEEALKSRL